MMRNLLATGLRCVYAILIASASLNTHAVELTVEAGYEAEYSDNVTLTSDDEQSGWIQTPQIGLIATHDGPSVSASADYRVSHEIYQHNTFDDQTTAEGTALLTWRAIADRLTFDLSNSSTQTTIDAQTQNVPTNQQVTNTATAGAVLTLDGPSNHIVELGYDYSVVTAQRTDTDSVRQTGTASYIIPISTERRVQLNASYGDVNYDSSQSIDYVSNSADLQYVSTGEVIELDTSIGYTVFDQSQQTDDVSGTTGDINIVWHANLNTTVTASYSRSVEDQSTDVAEGIPDFGESFDDNSGITTPFTLDAASLGISTLLGHNTVDLIGYIDSQDYDGGLQPDQDTKGVTLGIGRALRPTLHARVYGNYWTVDFKDSDTQDNYSAGIRFDWTRWRNVTVSAGTEYRKRTSDFPTEEYKEWAGSISLMYMMIGRRK
jgi:hypothetical protein